MSEQQPAQSPPQKQNTKTEEEFREEINNLVKEYEESLDVLSKLENLSINVESNFYKMIFKQMRDPNSISINEKIDALGAFAESMHSLYKAQQTPFIVLQKLNNKNNTFYASIINFLKAQLDEKNSALSNAEQETPVVDMPAKATGKLSE